MENDFQISKQRKSAASTGENNPKVVSKLPQSKMGADK
jgi:hypothetical protein